MTLSTSWSVTPTEGVTLVVCEPLRNSGLSHAFSTRRADGDPEFDLGSAGPPTPETGERRMRFLRAAGLGGAAAVQLRQVHGNRLRRAPEVRDGAEGDGVIWLVGDPPDRIPAIRTADCVPVLLVEKSGRAAAAVHAGWRGTAAGIAARAVETLVDHGVGAGDLIAALGPAIGGCCYEVGPDVAERVAGACGCAAGEISRAGAGDRRLLDLRRANRLQLQRAGLAPDSIQAYPGCTACQDRRFWSWRRDGRAAGRLLAAIGRSAAGPSRPSP